MESATTRNHIACTPSILYPPKAPDRSSDLLGCPLGQNQIIKRKPGQGQASCLFLGSLFPDACISAKFIERTQSDTAIHWNPADLTSTQTFLYEDRCRLWMPLPEALDKAIWIFGSFLSCMSETIHLGRQLHLRLTIGQQRKLAVLAYLISRSDSQ